MALAASDGETLVCSVLCVSYYTKDRCVPYCRSPSHSYDVTSHINLSGFGGLELPCWPFVPKFAGSHPAEVVGFLMRKVPQHAFLRRGRKAVGPMS